MTTLTLILMFLTSDAFVVDASAEASYTVSLSREALRGYVDDIGLFARNMPGVIAVRAIDEHRYLYQTEKDLPLSGTLRTDFVIEKTTHGDSVTVYHSVDVHDTNYMLCRVHIRPLGDAATAIDIRLRVRLSRTNAGEIHWMAPVLGENFISGQMTKDLHDMLQQFVESSNRELYRNVNTATVSK